MVLKVSKQEINLAVLAAGMNGEITQEQFDARVDKIKHIAKLRKSGKYRILSVDEDDYSDGELIYDFNAEEDALLFVLLSREINQAAQQSTLEKMRMPREKQDKLLGGEISAQSLDPENTIEKLRLNLTAWKPITSEVMFLYNPDGDYIGEYPI